MDCPSTKVPIVIRSGSFTCTLYDINDLFRLPISSLRTLWRIMFDALNENEETVQKIKTWLPSAVIERKARQTVCMADLKSKQREVAAYGGAATKEQKRCVKEAECTLRAAIKESDHAVKIQQIFNDFTNRTRFIKKGA